MNLCALLLLLPVSSLAFAPIGHLNSHVLPHGLKTVLQMADVSVTNPSSDDAADMGIRDWPQQLKKGTWNEEAKEGQTLIRYILDGTGVLDTEADDLGQKSYKLTPGTLVEITGQASLDWKAKDELIVLTPGFEEGGKFIGVLVVMLLTFGALLGSTL
mmetsp:Transcript_16004/g.39197  ORF Transcript_16004/g.39197 Transcript_16004/m.39197 type:complete len:158 (+) Transcript_16004:156-629(+)